jgi:hypothetical protein
MSLLLHLKKVYNKAPVIKGNALRSVTHLKNNYTKNHHVITSTFLLNYTKCLEPHADEFNVANNMNLSIMGFNEYVTTPLAMTPLAAYYLQKKYKINELQTYKLPLGVIHTNNFSKFEKLKWAFPSIMIYQANLFSSSDKPSELDDVLEIVHKSLTTEYPDSGGKYPFAVEETPHLL